MFGRSVSVNAYCVGVRMMWLYVLECKSVHMCACYVSGEM